MTLDLQSIEACRAGWQRDIEATRARSSELTQEAARLQIQEAALSGAIQAAELFAKLAEAPEPTALEPTNPE